LVQVSRRCKTRRAHSPKLHPSPPQIGFVFEPQNDARIKLKEKRLRYMLGSWIMVPTRDSGRPALETYFKHHPIENPLFGMVLNLARKAFDQLGKGCKEKVYQKFIGESAWFRKNKIQCKMEQRIEIFHVSPPRFGFIDLMVDDRLLFEMKATECTEDIVEKDRLQINTYLQALASIKHPIDRAALIYITPTGVRVVEVDPNWNFLSSEPELSLDYVFLCWKRGSRTSR